VPSKTFPSLRYRGNFWKNCTGVSTADAALAALSRF
jgi:hypothetical protein